MPGFIFCKFSEIQNGFLWQFIVISIPDETNKRDFFPLEKESSRMETIASHFYNVATGTLALVYSVF